MQKNGKRGRVRALTLMFTMTKEQYLENPCRVSSIPYWKTGTVTVPAGMEILHRDDFVAPEWAGYTDEPYFRLRHDLQGLSTPILCAGYSLCNASLDDFAAHINCCYESIGITGEELRHYTARAVYDPALWLAVRDERTGKIVATGIGELDRELGEGVLEWVQVSPEHRGQGLGRYIVLELLRRMKDSARFATVSGQCHNPTAPESLYRACGFTGTDVWHILRKRETP